ncbi:MAG TPA: hypothetical protein VFW33_12560 [Gemmataceae bacterium]|nr:hypothetical protein [Gemmataceae bacterium]
MPAKAKPHIQHPAQHERDAARRYLEHSHAAQHLAGKPRAEAERNAQAIDEEHARARDIALTGTARELGKLPAHLRRHQAEERQRAGITTEQAASIRHEYRSRPEAEPESPEDAPSRPRRERARAAAGAAASGSGRAAAAAYDAASDTSTGELIGEIFLWGVGLSLFYLLLTRAAAVGKLFEGATNIARAVVSPVVDPLNPKGAL